MTKKSLKIFLNLKLIKMNSQQFITHLQMQIDNLKKNKMNINNIRQKIIEMENNYELQRRER